MAPLSTTLSDGVSAAEESYMLLAEAITEVGAEHEVRFLAKLALSLGLQTSDKAALQEAIAAAKADI